MEEPKNKPQALKPRTVKQDKSIEETVRGGDTTNTARRNAKRERKAMPECKLQLKEKPEPIGLDKRCEAIREPRDLLKAWKRSFNKISGNYQFSLNRLKSVLLEKWELIMKAFLVKKKHMNWEYAQKCIYECEITRTCMINRNIRSHVWNRYSRKYALLGDNVVCMMHDKISMHIMKVPTTIWNLHSNELRHFKELVYAYEYMRCSKICTSKKWIRNNEIYCLCVMKYTYSVWKTWYVLESKNHIINIHFCSKAKIQLSPQIKLWGGSGLRENESKTHTNLWKNLYLLLKLWDIGEKMAAASATNVDMEMDMVDENEINSSFQKRPTMAQVTISQKKAKGELVIEPKRLPFWLGFEAMNWTNRTKDYPVDSMELISELIRKGMEIEEATECQ